MSWLEALGIKPTQQTQQTQQPAQQQPGQGGYQADPNVTQQVQQQTQVAQQQENPLDLLMQLGQNGGNGQQGQAPSFNIPQDTLTKVAQSMDYSKAISPEDLAALQQGDVSKLGNILNSALQMQYQTIMGQMSQLTDVFVGNRLQHEQSNLQSSVRGQLVENSIQLKDQHPLAQRMFKDTAKQLAQQFPDATVQDIEQRTWALMESLGKQFDRTGQQQVKAQKASEVDWDEFLG